MFKYVGVIGAGTMGAGIAMAIATCKSDVYLYDVNDTVLRRAVERIKSDLKKGVQKGKLTTEESLSIIERIRPKTHLPDLSPSDFIIEAVVEDLRVKRDLLRRVEEVVKHGTIIASNTSSLPITSIAAGVKLPSKVVGMHFFNPAHIMKLVEVIRGDRTSEETIHSTMAFASSLGKTPVIVKDTPGFIVNRVARPFYGEALRIAGENIATYAQIDRICRSVAGFAMGPFELMDLIGIDVNLSVTQSMYDQFSGEPRYRPHPIQKRMVEAGKLGRKTNEGFYTYDEFKKTKVEGSGN
ncbi:MAG: 3-hydroxybutyryl-CoA dehydrogenase [Ignavibacteria bacterium GWA2_55_11]|nr:MAG: 3-hydroxybutyryl-CoA dehydrogenase [Ignavibacteria bacterium GWA2_55_11]OGU43484.1 MAG: 3-hydroxybutyryl-CoA dehydrogenase [Ignavibacteria bacterium GWC2_56_12]OGU71898.1 MAG: 3-hydroxybutyryl-CoA dehydrogenase [Ignavibacteria bacterium RIFCSPLOWO2_12_FULL_56_21]